LVFLPLAKETNQPDIPRHYSMKWSL